MDADNVGQPTRHDEIQGEATDETQMKHRFCLHPCSIRGSSKSITGRTTNKLRVTTIQRELSRDEANL